MFARTPQELTVEEVSAIHKRMVHFSRYFIARLRAARLEVDTYATYLANRPEFSVEVPSRINNLTVQMTFDLQVVVRSGVPVARVRISFDHGRPRYFTERSAHTGLPIPRITVVCLRAVKERDISAQLQEIRLRKKSNAEQKFLALSETLGLSSKPESPYVIGNGNFRARCLTRSPERVMVGLVVSHEEATEIYEKYGRKGKVEVS